MVKVIERPFEFEAWQYNGEKNCLDTAPDWTGTVFQINVSKHSYVAFFKETPSGIHQAMKTGDWILRVPPRIGPVIEEIVTYKLIPDCDFVKKYKVVG